ncbi:unnamed protein product [Prorocentrum cordatum]|uniref:Tubulin-specific chaperone A n=1 Tax=Prorocentrum cordatum TaxID=2364126 RepID=A0ABN9WAQ7_9DINO|nr:unnamed protein product [Polarella glacialis]
MAEADSAAVRAVQREADVLQEHVQGLRDECAKVRPSAAAERDESARLAEVWERDQ